MRRAGILMHISSLPNPYGIGTLGQSSFQFIDFLKQAHQHYWQVLPLGHTSYGDSPYQTFSAFAGNPYFIDLDLLCDEGLLDKQDYQILMTNSNYVDFGFQYNNRYPILRKAFEKFIPGNDYYYFLNKNNYWLNNYALFMSLKTFYGGASWLKWDERYKKRDITSLNEFEENNLKEISFWKFIQFYFYKQWHNVKKYANSQGIEIIGDIPIYVAMDSADVWANINYFAIDDNYTPIKVAGCPPDYFSKTGQLWGNPVYNWDNLKKDNYSWWVQRIKNTMETCDVVRIDHFRGFEAFWAVPYGDLTAENGEWIKGPNTDFFASIKNQLGDVRIIAEDLGFLTKSFYDMFNKLPFPGLKVIEFGFEPDEDSTYALHNIIPNCVVYPATHDSPPIKEWFDELDDYHKEYVLKYINQTDKEKIVSSIIKLCLASVANLVIIQMQDYLEIGPEGKMNKPSLLGNNWIWRASTEQLSTELATKIADWCKVYKRS